MEKEDNIEKNLTDGGNSPKESWFRRMQKNITTSTKDKKETPDGLWIKCPKCNYTCTRDELEENLYVCPKCEYHHRIGSAEYFKILFDKETSKELYGNIRSKDYLQFVDLKPYSKRLEEAYSKTNIHDSITVGLGKLSGKELMVDCMDFDFIGGSLGSVMGEKIARSIDHCIKHNIPLLIISRSGGARMMESAFSLMQMAKTSAFLVKLSDAKIPYFSLCTDPTFGGTTASFAMLGDIIMAEPGALIGFAGPRVIKETIKKDLPPGFQRSEFLLEHGFLDFIVSRKELKERLNSLLTVFGY
jgi:acetyl-CoA carboxylase carboxyl transferase subunit beta